SDVCSSDLGPGGPGSGAARDAPAQRRESDLGARLAQARLPLDAHRPPRDLRRRHRRPERATDHPRRRREHGPALGPVSPLAGVAGRRMGMRDDIGSGRASRARLREAVLLCAAAAWLAGCVTVAEHRELEREVLTMKRGGSGERVADLGAQLSDIERRLDAIEGRLDDVSNEARMAHDEARKARAEGARAPLAGVPPDGAPYGAVPAPSAPLDEPGPRSTPPATAAAPPVAAPVAPPSPADTEPGEPALAGASAEEVAEYRAAHAAWRAGDLDGCIDRFKRFLQTRPASPYADDAAYWMAECHFKQGDYKSAILRFDDVVARYPEGDKSADALYRQGEALLKLGPGYAKAAGKAFERVIEEYPSSPRAA